MKIEYLFLVLLLIIVAGSVHSCFNRSERFNTVVLKMNGSTKTWHAQSNSIDQSGEHVCIPGNYTIDRTYEKTN